MTEHGHDPHHANDDPIACDLDRHLVEIDLADLGLIPHASTAAQSLKTQFPAVIFTSGRRSVDKQADAMAGNIVVNRKWIEQSYTPSNESRQLQKWVDDNPGETTKAQISAGLKAIMSGWNDDQRVRLSRHFAGLAFDVSPTSGEDVKTAINKLDNLKKFLDEEGGIEIWHAEFNKK